MTVFHKKRQKKIKRKNKNKTAQQKTKQKNFLQEIFRAAPTLRRGTSLNPSSRQRLLVSLTQEKLWKSQSWNLTQLRGKKHFWPKVYFFPRKKWKKHTLCATTFACFLFGQKVQLFACKKLHFLTKKSPLTRRTGIPRFRRWDNGFGGKMFYWMKTFNTLLCTNVHTISLKLSSSHWTL